MESMYRIDTWIDGWMMVGWMDCRTVDLLGLSWQSPLTGRYRFAVGEVNSEEAEILAQLVDKVHFRGSRIPSLNRNRISP